MGFCSQHPHQEAHAHWYLQFPGILDLSLIPWVPTSMRTHISKKMKLEREKVPSNVHTLESPPYTALLGC